MISLCIIISAAALEGSVINSALDLGKALEPLYGTAAPLLLQFGFFAAGLTSALTAPMAAAFVVSECFGLPKEGWGYRITAFAVLAIGVYFTTTGIVPIEIIRFAQITNGILLPIIGMLLLFMVNNSQLMRGTVPSNLQKTCFILIELFLSFRNKKFRIDFLMKSIDINCDMGEGTGNDAALMPYISSCSIACGGHFGNAQTIAVTLEDAQSAGVKVGSHPSYPDQLNFWAEIPAHFSSSFARCITTTIGSFF